MTWININQTFITSLLLWEHRYDPYQTIIFRKNHKNHIKIFLYFKIRSNIVAFQESIFEFRTETEEERMFQVARISLLKLEELLIDKQVTGENAENSKLISQHLNKLFDEAFLSSYALELMRERSPEFGFYSISPNIKKIELMLLGKPYSLMNHIRFLNLTK
jgi:hypothetical protein